MFLLKYPFESIFRQLFRFVIIKVLSQFQFFSFVTNLVFQFCHNLSFSVLSQIEFLSFVTIWVFCLVTIWVAYFEFYHNLRYITIKVFFHNLSFVTIWFIISFVTVWVLGFFHNMSFWVLSPFLFFWG